MCPQSYHGPGVCNQWGRLGAEGHWEAPVCSTHERLPCTTSCQYLLPTVPEEAWSSWRFREPGDVPWAGSGAWEVSRGVMAGPC